MDCKASLDYIARPAQKIKKRRREGEREGGEKQTQDATYEVGKYYLLIYAYEKKSQKYTEDWSSAIIS